MSTLRKAKIAVGQAGGPTAVINASLTGFVEEAKKHYQVYGIVNSFQGLIEDWLIEIEGDKFDRLRSFRNVPAAVLGSGRWRMTEDDYRQAVLNLHKRHIQTLVMIGGNGTMEACLQLERTARQMDVTLSVIGIPKTVDNDLLQTDHAPGYGSAARYVASSIRDIGEDLKSMSNFEKVRIVETMGRNVGWLTAASLLLKEHEDQPPHLIYVPERAFRLQSFLDDVNRTVERIGYALVVVSEGVKDETGTVLSQISLTNGSNHNVLGGVSGYMAKQVAQQLQLPVRSELLGMNQRCSQINVSETDRMEAELLGREAVRLIRDRQSGVMLTLKEGHQENGRFAYKVSHCKFEEVAGKERQLPDFVLNKEGTMITPAFRAWLRTLVGDDITGYPEWVKHKQLS